MALHNNEETFDLPIVDISSKSALVARDLLDATSQYGFVFIRGYRDYITPEDIDTMFDLVVFIVD